MVKELYVVLAEDELGQYLVEIDNESKFEPRYIGTYEEALLIFEVMSKHQHTDYRIAKLNEVTS